LPASFASLLTSLASLLSPLATALCALLLALFAALVSLAAALLQALTTPLAAAYAPLLTISMLLAPVFGSLAATLFSSLSARCASFLAPLLTLCAPPLLPLFMALSCPLHGVTNLLQAILFGSGAISTLLNSVPCAESLPSVALLFPWRILCGCLLLKSGRN
jgi:hypothetical protein